MLTNSNNTIQGAGNIGDGQMGLVNNGTILSNGFAFPMGHMSKPQAGFLVE
ncbi:MAG: hypothetical protein WA655_16210 [Candidatus Korobacteraceae bacterium]